jgi:hypothetical protein
VTKGRIVFLASVYVILWLMQGDVFVMAIPSTPHKPSNVVTALSPRCEPSASREVEQKQVAIQILNSRCWKCLAKYHISIDASLSNYETRCNTTFKHTLLNTHRLCNKILTLYPLNVVYRLMFPSFASVTLLSPLPPTSNMILPPVNISPVLPRSGQYGTN